MPSASRKALRELIAALEHHYEIARSADVVTDAVFEDAEAQLEDAFFTYDDVLFTDWGIALPLELVDDFEDEDDEDEGDEESGSGDFDEEELDEELLDEDQEFQDESLDDEEDG